MAARLGTSHSDGNISVGSRLSDTRREKLINMKKREDLKDAITSKFKSRFGHGAVHRGDDEVSVASTAIRHEVDRFAKTAEVTEANLGRLERRLHNRAVNQVDDTATVTGVSAYSGMSGRRSVVSLTGRNIMSTTAPDSFDWSKLDEYASYLHEQDALRQKVGIQAIQRKLRMDLDQQSRDKQMRRNEHTQEDHRYFQNSLVELERWKQQEQAREEEKHMKLHREKQDRDEQLNFERKLKAEEVTKRKDEEASLVQKIITEMEAEQKRFEKKKDQTKRAMRKVFEENMEDQQKRISNKKEQMERESQNMREYNRILDEQEEQRAEEMSQRMARQAELMKKLEANVEGIKKGAGDNDAQRALAQADEQDKHFFEAESVKQARLKQMRHENQAYLMKQMSEKGMRKDEERQLQAIQAAILERDSEEYTQIETQKVLDKKLRNMEHRKDVESQMAYRQKQTVPEMSEAEIQMNKPLLHLVTRTLQLRDDNMKPSRLGADEEDDF